MQEYYIPSQALASFTAKIDKLNRKAAKLNCPPIVVNELRFEDVKHEDGTATRRHIVTVTGEAPKLNGWSFVATLDHLANGNLLKVIPGEPDLPEQYRTRQECDYCHKGWLHRKSTFIVRNEQGVLKQVGRQCLADFLGGQSPKQIAALAEALALLPDEIDCLCDGYKMPREPLYLQLEAFLAMTAAVIKQEGWISRKMAYNDNGRIATADVASSQIVDGAKMRPRERIPTNEDHYQLARKVIEWARQIKPRTDYEHNVQLLTQDSIFPITGIGIIASLIPGYQREVERNEAAKREPSGNSQFIGKEGDRIEVKIKVLRVHYTDGGDYQDSTAIVKMQDEQGSVYTWFTASTDMEQGESYTIKGTVKRHHEYKGNKETVLTRCKILQS